MVKANLYYGKMFEWFDSLDMSSLTKRTVLNGHKKTFTDRNDLISYMSKFTKEYMAQSSVLEIFEDTVDGYGVIITESDSDYGKVIAIITGSE